MHKLLSLPPNLVESFHEIERVDRDQWFCTSDPVSMKLGSGGGTVWLLRQWEQARGGDDGGKRILIHAGGQSRRLPSYAPSGKVLTPIPVLRWARGQKIGQDLLTLQLPLYERILSMAPDSLRTLIASGDVYIRAEKPLHPLPEADVVCYGLWVDPSLATQHGVYVLSRRQPDVLDYMLQKPSLAELENLTKTHFFLMDIGIWLLSDRALALLRERSMCPEAARRPEPWGDLRYYDLYSDFGLALGQHPRVADEALNGLSVAILPLPGGEFYHYGTSRELLSSTLSLQNKVHDQRQIMHRKVKPHPAIFIQNAEAHVPLSARNANLWIENSYVGRQWRLGERQIITGVPENDWALHVPDGTCVDIVPISGGGWAVRPYGFDDAFKGALGDAGTLFMGRPFQAWAQERGIGLEGIEREKDDLQAARIFPVVHSVEEMGAVLGWMIGGQKATGQALSSVEASHRAGESGPMRADEAERGKAIWLRSRRICADEISAQADLRALCAQRAAFLGRNLPQLAANYEKSVFYQLDLADAAEAYHAHGLPAPAPLPADSMLMQRIHGHMLRARIAALDGDQAMAQKDEAEAFSLLRRGLMADMLERRSRPRMNVYSDQIVWGRSPVRIDMAGGWTDTPPYSLYAGGNVVNIAIELNGQQPLQVYVKPARERQIVLRSIDMGAVEVVHTFEELTDFNHVGSPFSIPKAALALAGFAPAFAQETFATLEEQLEAFGAGLEVTSLSAIPAGSGLGTSSILASTVLGALSDFCGLAWDKDEICRRTLALEQLLTTGGGWQDQYGGVLQGIKLLQTEAGFTQHPVVRWLPEHIFTHPDYRDCHLLYYTGITRTAKNILAEIVRSMFLNSSAHLAMLEEMKAHALDMAEAIQHNDFTAFGGLVAKTWGQNQLLDSGTNPPAVEGIIRLIDDYCLGYKLPGAGGGGYLYMVAKDPQAALRIRQTLTQNAPNWRARFVDMALSPQGFQVSRS